LALLGMASCWALVTASAWGSSVTFEHTGAEQTFTVPAGVSSVHVVAAGGAGGIASIGQSPWMSFGATVTADLPVAPGQVLYVEVGGGGKNAQSSSIHGGADGFNGGADAGWGYHGTSSGGGGGASDVRTSPRSAADSLASRLLVAGGGGGSTSCTFGGDADSSGNKCQPGAAPQAGSGGAGTLTAGGASGLGYSDAQAGSRGALGLGGAGGPGWQGPPLAGDGGGGGGGGYFGGGGGAGGGGSGYGAPAFEGSGGGGSSFVTPRASNAAISHRTNRSNIRQVSGEVTISTPTTPNPTAPTITAFKLTNTRFIVGAQPTATNAKAKIPRGSAFLYTISKASTATIVIERQTPGRLIGKKCVAQTKANAKKKRCTITKRAGTLTRNSKAGSNKVAFSGRIGRPALTPATYRATITARGGKGPNSKPRSAAFTVVRS
jgi:hypothetical protein